MLILGRTRNEWCLQKQNHLWSATNQFCMSLHLSAILFDLNDNMLTLLLVSFALCDSYRCLDWRQQSCWTMWNVSLMDIGKEQKWSRHVQMLELKVSRCGWLMVRWGSLFIESIDSWGINKRKILYTILYFVTSITFRSNFTFNFSLSKTYILSAGFEWWTRIVRAGPGIRVQVW